MKRIGTLVIATFALILCGCSHPPLGTPSAKVSLLYLHFSADPDQVYTAESPTSRTIYFTLDVTNNSDKRYDGVASVGSVFHVIVRSGDKIIWEGPELAKEEERPMYVLPKADHDYIAVWHIKNVQMLPPGPLVAEAIYTPTGDKRTLILPVGIEKAMSH